MYLIDLTNTSHSKANTGIQRFCRELHTALLSKYAIQAITWDPYLNNWRGLYAGEIKLLSVENIDKISKKRRPHWSLGQKLKGYSQRLFSLKPRELKNHYHAFIVPEVFSEENYSHFKGLEPYLNGPKVAVFHDLIPLKFPALSSPNTIARLSSYLKELATFDAVAPNSEASKNDLLKAWNNLNITNIPLVKAIPLCVDRKNIKLVHPNYSKTTKNILCVSSIEGRKNHLALLQAAEQLWSHGENFQLTLVGLANPESGQQAKELIASLKAKNRSVRWLGSVNEETLNKEYDQAYFTIYPSLYEGFGLPVLESLIRSIPCVCSTGGALAETAKGGGCLLLNNPSSNAIAQGILKLLKDEAFHKKLVQEAVDRKFRTWDEYTHDLSNLIEEARTLQKTRQYQI